jgi:hypothetical protein
VVATTTTTLPAPVVKSASRATKITIDANLPVSRLAAAVRHAALTIFRRHAHTVTVKAPVDGNVWGKLDGRAKRVKQIDSMLAADVRNLGSSAPRIFVRWTKSSETTRPPFNINLTVSP